MEAEGVPTKARQVLGAVPRAEDVLLFLTPTLILPVSHVMVRCVFLRSRQRGLTTVK